MRRGVAGITDAIVVAEWQDDPSAAIVVMQVSDGWPQIMLRSQEDARRYTPRPFHFCDRLVYIQEIWRAGEDVIIPVAGAKGFVRP